MKNDITNQQENLLEPYEEPQKMTLSSKKIFMKNADDLVKSSFLQESHCLTKTSRLSLNEIIEKHIDRGIGVGSTIYHYMEVQEIVEMVCNYYSVSFFDLCSTSRKRYFVLPRQIILCIILETMSHKFSQSLIGDLVAREHATVIHAQKTVYNLEFGDKRFRTTMEFIRNSARSIIMKYTDEAAQEMTKDGVFFALLNSVKNLKRIDSDHWVRMYKSAGDRKEVTL